MKITNKNNIKSDNRKSGTTKTFKYPFLPKISHSIKKRINKMRVMPSWSSSVYTSYMQKTNINISNNSKLQCDFGVMPQPITNNIHNDLLTNVEPDFQPQLNMIYPNSGGGKNYYLYVYERTTL